MDISTAELEGAWDVEIVPFGSRMTLAAGQGEFAPQCNSWCGPGGGPKMMVGEPYAMTTIGVEIVHLVASNDMGIFTISMRDEALFGGVKIDPGTDQPFMGQGDEPNFWLEGLMTIKFRLHGNEEVVSLVSSEPILQVGRASQWPPHGTVMRDVSGPNEYHRVDDPAQEPFLRLWSGSITITDRVSPFLEADITVREFEYLNPTGSNRTEGVRLAWNDERDRIPLIDHYHVLRRRYDLHHSEPWEGVSECIRDSVWTDLDFDGSSPYTYKIRQVFVDPLGDELRGCGRETDFTVPGLPRNRGQLLDSGFWG